MTPLLRVKHFDSFDRFFSTQFTISPKSTQRQETRGQRIGFQIFEPGFREEVPPKITGTEILLCFTEVQAPSTRMHFQKFAFPFHRKRNESIASTRSFSDRFTRPHGLRLNFYGKIWCFEYALGYRVSSMQFVILSCVLSAIYTVDLNQYLHYLASASARKVMTKCLAFPARVKFVVQIRNQDLTAYTPQASFTF